MQIIRFDTNGNTIKRNEIHNLINENKQCNEIIANAINQIKTNNEKGR